MSDRIETPPGAWKTLWWTKLAIAVFWSWSNWTLGFELSGPGMVSLVVGPLAIAVGTAKDVAS